LEDSRGLAVRRSRKTKVVEIVLNPTLIDPVTEYEAQVKARIDEVFVPCSRCDSAPPSFHREKPTSPPICCRCHVRAGGDANTAHRTCMAAAAELEEEEKVLVAIARRALSSAHVESMICNIPDGAQRNLVRNKLRSKVRFKLCDDEKTEDA
jgi:hypothetical protein